MKNILLTDEINLLPKKFLDITKEKYYFAVNSHSSPMFAWFSLNDACNLNCKYCFADSKYLNKDPNSHISDFLSTKDVKTIIDNVANAGTKMIMFAGGEPTLRKDLPDLISYTSRFMDVSMNTNGYLVTAPMARELALAGLSQVKISVDGLQKNHDWNRGEGSFEKAIASAMFFKEAGVEKVMLIMTLSSQNYSDLMPLLEKTMAMGIDFTMVEFLPIGRASSEKSWCLNKEQLKNAQRSLFEAQSKYGWMRVAFENRYIVSEDLLCKSISVDKFRPCGFYDFCVGCISGIYSYIITPKGTVAAGDILTLECGDLRKEDLSKIWKEADLFKMLKDRENLEGKCGSCIYKYVCGGCRRRAYALTGRLMAGDPGCWVDPRECVVD